MALVTSYGVLLYRKQLVNYDESERKSGTHRNTQETSVQIEYLLGLIPQRNWWTVFKGLPDEDTDESPHATALREFEEETGTKGIVSSIQPEYTLYGKAGKKQLEIYLQDGSDFDVSSFRPDRVVKIDSGYMQGQPEIVDIQWMTLSEALHGRVL